MKKAVEDCALTERVFVLMDSDRAAVGGPEASEQQKIRGLVKTRPNVADLETHFPDAKQHVHKLCDPALVPDAPTLESRAGTTELVKLLDTLEAWL